MHYIQHYILDKLIQAEKQRFTDLRYPGVESNLFQYHLGHVMRQGYVSKLPEGGYTLTPMGLHFADRYSTSLKAERPQPKIIVIPVIKRPDGSVLLIKKLRQPFVGTYHLPAGKIHPEENLHVATAREVMEKLGATVGEAEYLSTVHVTITKVGEIISEFYGFVMNISGNDTCDGVWWDESSDLELAPSVREIIALSHDANQKFHELQIDV